jgi:agmatinase
MIRSEPGTTFLRAPFVSDLDRLDADFVFVGVPCGSPYDTSRPGPSSQGPDTVRRAVEEFGYVTQLDHFDFDCDGPLLPENARLVDAGDVAVDLADVDAGKRETTEAIRAIVASGAVPLVVGGDDSIPPLVAAGFRDTPGIHVLHIDAHVDFRDELGGIRDGYSSPIRRVRELPGIGEIVQVGLRGVGSARAIEVESARAAGNRLVTASELHERGAGAVFAQLPDDRPWFVTIDCDGLDPSVAPGVAWPEPDGLSYRDVATFVRGLAREGRLAGIEFTEFVPALDVRSLTALAISRLLMNVVSLTPLGRPVSRSNGQGDRLRGAPARLARS